MADSEVTHVAIAPSSNTDADVIRSVAAVLNKTPYDTRLLLAGEIPRIVAHYENMQMAESTVQKLRQLGLAAIACRDSDLRHSSQGFRAQTLEFSEKHVVFRDSGGHEKRIGQDDVFLILEGKMETLVEVLTTKQQSKFSLTRTLIAGGIPIWQKVDQKSTARSVQVEYFARLYDRESSTPGVEILQHLMNYSFLGEKMTASSVTNFGTVVLKLREAFPQAVFDDRLMKPLGVTPDPSAVRQDADANCRLIYLFHSVGGGGDSST